jgi:hypothetical protein
MVNVLYSAFSSLFGVIPTIGWLFLITAAIKFTWQFSGYQLKIKSFLDDTKMVENTVNVLTTNHLPHLQTGIDENTDEIKNVGSAVHCMQESILVELKGIRSDLLQYALRDK